LNKMNGLFVNEPGDFSFNITIMRKTAFVGLLITLFVNLQATAQDTVRVSLEEFIEKGTEYAGQLKYEQQKINLAENKVVQVQSKRYLPKFELSTQHGIVPGVISQRSDLDPDEYYLDPNL